MLEADYIPSEKPLFNVRLCTNKRFNKDGLPSCAGRGSRELVDKIEKILLDQSIPAKLVRSPCMNNCKIGPNLQIQRGDLFNEVTEDCLDDIIEAIKAEVALRKAESETSTSGTSLQHLSSTSRFCFLKLHPYFDTKGAVYNGKALSEPSLHWETTRIRPTRKNESRRTARR